MLCVDEQRKRVGRVRSLPVNCSWPQSAYMPHTTGSIECILLWQRQLKRTFAETISQLWSFSSTVQIPAFIGACRPGLFQIMRTHITRTGPTVPKCVSML